MGPVPVECYSLLWVPLPREERSHQAEQSWIIHHLFYFLLNHPRSAPQRNLVAVSLVFPKIDRD